MQIFIIVIALSLSFFFSGTETIFLSASKIKLEIWLHQGIRRARLVKSFVMHPETFIITTLVGNNISNIAFSSVVAIFLEEHFNHFTIITISSMTALIFGEIIPKAMGWELSNKLILLVAVPLRFFQLLFSPINYFFNRISSFIVNLFDLPESRGMTFITKKDVEALIHESEKAGIVEKSEREIISRVFGLLETRVKETMVPRTDITAVKKSDSMEKVLKVFRTSGYSRVPVYEKNLDNIIGVVYAKDLFSMPKKLSEVMEDVERVPETKNAFQLLQEFRRKKTSIAIVMDEYGGTEGLVTFEDLVEELFGEIYDEFDLDHEEQYKKLNAFTLLVNARAEIDELNQKFHLQLPEGDYTTIGGFIIDHLGKIPKRGELMELEYCKLEVTRATRKQVTEVKIIVKSQENA